MTESCLSITSADIMRKLVKAFKLQWPVNQNIATIMKIRSKREISLQQNLVGFCLSLHDFLQVTQP